LSNSTSIYQTGDIQNYCYLLMGEMASALVLVGDDPPPLLPVEPQQGKLETGLLLLDLGILLPNL